MAKIFNFTITKWAPLVKMIGITNIMLEGVEYCVMFILMSHLPYHLIQVCIFVSIVFFMVATSQIGSGGMCGVLLCGCSGIVEVKLFFMVKPLTRSRF